MIVSKDDKEFIKNTKETGQIRGDRIKKNKTQIKRKAGRSFPQWILAKGLHRTQTQAENKMKFLNGSRYVFSYL